MKKLLLTFSLALAGNVGAQFSSGTVSLGTTGMTVKLDTTPTLATITVTGADTSYLGIGFGALGEGMGAGKDGFIYNSTTNRDYSFSGVGNTPTADASQDWTQTSNTTSGGIRTVIATRSLAGGAGDTAIPNAAGTIDIFFAKGTATALSSGWHGAANRGYATLTMAATLGTNEVDLANKKVILYPNPAKEIVNFKNADKIKTIDIYEASGRKVKSIKFDGENVNINDLKSGNYYFEITQKDGTLSYEKLIKE
ncbi:T9SS type A sorting domain-containing protein [Chryseobacterium oryctis]|uniref:T9SS type A sorting domain-containing protein n=1 Tax=Chryseobacterium oryctis TaxID=2952618 RepID=A0ABT3HKF5_9FLAO|nr:T9SS type A sorting domain-containing protein [Chryseobacterium oryctis]MCW3160193.1 T9SS type A sorting domain-containing protein [Chryseobacterium oryctis]